MVPELVQTNRRIEKHIREMNGWLDEADGEDKIVIAEALTQMDTLHRTNQRTMRNIIWAEYWERFRK